MPPLHLSDLSDNELRLFKEQGFVRLGHVAPATEIEALCQRINDIMLGQVSYDNMLMQLCPSAGLPDLSRQTMQFKGSSLRYRKIQNLEQDPLFLAYMQKPLFRNLSRRIVGEDIAVFRAMFFNKPAEKGVTINWHQDGAGGWGLSIPPRITVWTALDATCIANGCLQLIPGSHHNIIPAQGDQLSAEECSQHAPDTRRIYLEMAKGEVVLLHNWTLHRSETNQTDRPRRAFSVCYIDAATRQRESGRDFPLIFPNYTPAQAIDEEQEASAIY